MLNAYLTNKGYEVLNRLLASQGTLEIVSAELGKGVILDETAARLRTSLLQKVCNADLVSVDFEGGEARIRVQYSNAGLKTGFFVNEIGIFVKNPAGGANVLYCYVSFGENPDWIAPESSAQYIREYDIKTIISNLPNVTITSTPSVLVSREELNNVVAPEYNSKSTYTRGDFVVYSGHLYRCLENITTAEPFNHAHWDDHTVSYYLERDEFVTTKPRFGVAGVGNSKAALTRLWDSVGKTATPGTDTVEAHSDFDGFAPFNRRKCVGYWTSEEGDDRAHFHVNAYYGDADYAEDGSMGDYVAVDVTPFYYIEDEDIIGVSEQCFHGWKIHPVCVDKDGNIREHTYLPCYAITLNEQGAAVSLPGGHNAHGTYAGMRNAASAYGLNGDAASANAGSRFAIIEPSEVDHYEWLLETIEFATQSCQSVMYGAASMPYSDHKILVAPHENQIVITKAQGAAYVIGQTILINNSYSTTVADSEFNQIVSMELCDAAGTPTSNGEYTLITYNGPDRSSGITVGTTAVSSRPWVTGACLGYAPGVGAVLGHTGSPVSNSDGKHPMMYRWRENTHSNQNMTSNLFDVRVDEGGDKYHLEWYLQVDQTLFKGNPSADDLNDPAKGFVKLGVVTPSSEYKDGYIRKLGYDERYPTVKVPIMTGGSATTYYCDYANLVHSTVVRCVRRRGHLTYGASSGLRYFHAPYAPSNASWHYGAALFFVQ